MKETRFLVWIFFLLLLGAFSNLPAQPLDPDDQDADSEFLWILFCITASAGGGGTISPSGDIYVFRHDSETFSISPDTGYEIGDVRVNGESVGAVESYTFEKVKSDQTIAAVFSRLEYHVAASAGNGGAISPGGEISVHHGDSLTFSISPDAGYEIGEVRVNGASVGAVPSYPLEKVTSDQTIEAEFSLLEYHVTALAGDGGTISPSGDVSVQYGDRLTFSLYPYTDYEIEDVRVNGTSVGVVDSYTFETVASDMTIEAVFAYIEPSAATADPDSDGVPDDEESGPNGDDPAYDGNGDGLPDCQQANVASFFDVHDHYVTIDVPEPGILKDVFPMTGTDRPEEIAFPCGLFHFIVEGLSDPNVTITLPDNVTINSYYKCGPTPDNTDEHWYEFMYDRGSQTGAVIDGKRIILYFVDGERGDDDLDGTNGIVIDEGGPAVASEAALEAASDDGEEEEEEEGCFITATAGGENAVDPWRLFGLAALFLLGCVRKSTARPD